MRTALGVDFGATKIACALVREDGSVTGGIAVEPTGNASAQETMSNLFRAIDRTLAGQKTAIGELAGIGIGSPGPISSAGVFGNVDTMPHLWGFDMGKAVAERYGRKPVVDNDANCFALAEAVFGGGRSEQIVVGITLGTGLGCGIVIDGKVLAGTTGNAGEVARCLVDGLIYDEALSGRGITGIYGEGLRGEQILALAEQHDARAIEAWRRYGNRLGAALGIIGAVLDPGAIILGGSVAAGFRWFGEHADAAMRRQPLDTGRGAPPALPQFTRPRRRLPGGGRPDIESLKELSD